MKIKVFTHVFLAFSIIFSLNFALSQTFIQAPLIGDAALGYHDGYGTENNNYVNAAQNGSYCIPGALFGLNINRFIIKFDLDVIPECAELDSAYLNLYALGAIGTLNGHSIGNNQSYINRVTQNWDLNTVTFNNQPSSTNQNQVILAASSSSNQNYLNIDVTNLVLDQLSNDNFGFLVGQMNETPDRVMLFCSNDNSDPAKRPSLLLKLKNCPVDSNSTVIDTTITDINEFFYVPNVITANNDELNDLFLIDCPKESDVWFQILNRWGNLIFETTSNKKFWDGKTKSGEYVTEGTYFVKYRVIFPSATIKEGHTFLYVLK